MAQRIKSRRRKAVKKQTVHYFDYSLLAIIIFLMCFGLVMLYSISSYEARTEDVYKRQDLSLSKKL